MQTARSDFAHQSLDLLPRVVETPVGHHRVLFILGEPRHQRDHVLHLVEVLPGLVKDQIYLLLVHPFVLFLLRSLQIIVLRLLACSGLRIRLLRSSLRLLVAAQRTGTPQAGHMLRNLGCV